MTRELYVEVSAESQNAHLLWQELVCVCVWGRLVEKRTQGIHLSSGPTSLVVLPLFWPQLFPGPTSLLVPPLS